MTAETLSSRTGRGSGLSSWCPVVGNPLMSPPVSAVINVRHSGADAVITRAVQMGGVVRGPSSCRGGVGAVSSQLWLTLPAIIL